MGLMSIWNSNANDWRKSPSPTYAVLSISGAVICPQQQIITHSVNEEDEYYILFYNSNNASRVPYLVTLLFERFEYLQPSTIGLRKDSCFAPSGGKCFVDIPYGTGSQLALVVTNIPVNVDWGENVDVKISCSRRDWAYAPVITLPAVLIFVIVCISLCLFYHKCSCRFRVRVLNTA